MLSKSLTYPRLLTRQWTQHSEKTFATSKFCVNHDQTQYLGSMFKRSLKLTKTQDSLDFELSVPKTPLGDTAMGILENEGGVLSTSIGFVSRGKKSNIKKVDVDEKTLEKVLSGESRANVTIATPLDSTEINLQTGRLDGSDYVESKGRVNGGRPWRVYRSLDLREISLLIGVDPAHEGVFAEKGTGKPQLTNDQQARARVLTMVKLKCLVG